MRLLSLLNEAALPARFQGLNRLSIFPQRGFPLSHTTSVPGGETERALACEVRRSPIPPGEKRTLVVDDSADYMRYLCASYRTLM